MASTSIVGMSSTALYTQFYIKVKLHVLEEFWSDIIGTDI